MSNVSLTQSTSIFDEKRAKEQVRASKAVSFANVSFDDFLSQGKGIYQQAALTINKSSLQAQQNSQSVNFTSLFKADSLEKLAQQGLRYDETSYQTYNEILDEYNGAKGDLKESESFLLSLMKELIKELNENAVDTEYLSTLKQNYSEQMDKKAVLADEVVKLANTYMSEPSETLYDEIVEKLQNYYNALDDGVLQDFFAPLLEHLSPQLQKEVSKALYTIHLELVKPTAFSLSDGSKLVWSIDESKISFKILSKEQLAWYFKQHQDAQNAGDFMDKMEQNDAKLDGAGLDDDFAGENVGVDLMANFDDIALNNLGLNANFQGLKLDNAKLNGTKISENSLSENFLAKNLAFLNSTNFSLFLSTALPSNNTATLNTAKQVSNTADLNTTFDTKTSQSTANSLLQELLKQV